jgi:hypothetical protein
MAIQIPQKDETERGDASTGGPSRNYEGSTRSTAKSKSQTSLRVLGIAMIVEERGAGARLVARYPTHPAAEEVQSMSSGTSRRNVDKAIPSAADDHRQHDDGENMDDNENSNINDLFFTLTARQMAKLFRTKKSLCNQPMTLRVNRTIFCCHAVLMDTEENSEADDKSDAEFGPNVAATSSQNSELTHFSIVVALNAPAGEASVPFSNFWDGNSEDQIDLERYLHHIATNATSGNDVNDDDVKKKKKKTASRVSSVFLAIRRVHISLARLGRALEREEHRCCYVSLQSEAFFKIRNEQQKRWEELALSASRAVGGGKQSATSTGSAMSSGNADSLPRKGRHVRQNSFGTAAGGTTALENALKKLVITPSLKQEQEKEQETLELMLSLPPPERRQGLPKHHGNLVRELCSVYHALSRKDYEYHPTPASLLCEQDSVVYINQHLAIPIEAAGLDSPQQSMSTDKSQFVQPYHTLLFPYASPSELLHTFLSSGSAAPQRMEQLLLTVNPQKPLTEIALDADLPLHVAIEIASFLVLRRVCVTSPVVSLQSRLACLASERIPDLLLDFSQAFPGINLFVVTSFLTNYTSLGHTMAVLTDTENEEGAWIREMLTLSSSYQNRARKSDGGNSAQRGRMRGAVSGSTEKAFRMPESYLQDHYSSLNLNTSSQTTTIPAGQEDSLLRPIHWMKDLEELLFSISVWLLSHRIIAHMQDYIVVVDAVKSLGQESKQIENLSDSDELLFKELLDLGYLNGDLTIAALSWRLGMDPHKLRAWGLRHNRVSVLTRVPRSADDDAFQPLPLPTSLKSSRT